MLAIERVNRPPGCAIDAALPLDHVVLRMPAQPMLRTKHRLHPKETRPVKRQHKIEDVVDIRINRRLVTDNPNRAPSKGCKAIGDKPVKPRPNHKIEISPKDPRSIGAPADENRTTAPVSY